MNCKKLLVLCGFLCLTCFTHAQTFQDSFSPGLPIPDNACGTDSLSAPITVTGIGALGVGGLKVDSVCLDITHTWSGDVEVSLLSPSGKQVLLTAGNGGSANNYTGTCFKDDATTSITNGSAPFTGTFIPEEPLGTFFGDNADGPWTLVVCDDASGDIGDLNSWGISFGPGPACINPNVSDTVRIVDCQSPFSIDVVIGTAGSGTLYTISDNQGTTPITGVGPGSLTNFGSYSIGTNVTITVTDEGDTSCVVMIPNIVVTQCPPSCPASLDMPLDGAIDQELAPLFTWSAPTTGGAPSGYNIVIGTTNPPVDTLGEFADTAVTIFGLDLNTTYYWYIVSVNALGESTGCAAAVQSFTTKGPPSGPMGVDCISPGASAAIAYTESFESGSSFPSGWTGDIGTGSTDQRWNIRSGATGSSNTGPTGASDGTFYMYYEASGTGATDSVYVTSPAINLGGAVDGAELSFDFHAFGPDVGTLAVGVGASATGPWTTVFEWIGPLQTSSAAAFVPVGVNLDTYIGGTIYLHFTATYGGGFAGDIAIDKLSIASCLSCSPITNVALSGVDSDTFGITWTDGVGCTGVEIEYGVSPYVLGTNAGSNVACGVQMFSASGLSATTNYQYYLIQNCSAAADTFGPFSFTTECGPIIPPNVEPFNTFLPDQCWNEAGDGTPATGPMDLGTGLWGADGFGNVGFTGAVRINLFTTNRTDWILSPQYDLSGGTFELKYDVAMTGFGNTLDTMLGSDDIVQILISIDSGLTWQALKTYNNTSIVPATGISENIDLSSYSNIVQFGVYASDGPFDDPNDIDFFIDNFEVSDPNGAPSCTMLTTPIDGAVDVNENITFVWPAAFGNPEGYRVSIGNSPGAADILNNFNVFDTLMYMPATFQYDSTYYVTITPYNNNGDASGCTETSFTVRSLPCGILDLSVNPIYATSAVATWTDEAGCNSVVVEYGEASFVLGTGTQIPVNCGIGMAQLANLVELTAYDVHVISSCASGSDTTSTSFTTTCDVQSVPTLQPFNTFLPTVCWREATSGTPATGPSGFGSGNWAADGFGNVGTTGSARINLFSNTTSDWLISPMYDISTGGPYNLIYDVALTGFLSTTIDTMLGSDDIVEVLITVDSGATWVTLEQYNNSSNIPAIGMNHIEDLTGYSGVVQFAFYATDGVVDDANDVNFYIDNFEISSQSALPGCAMITGPLDGATDVNEEVDLTWLAGEGITLGYELVLGTTPGGIDVLDSVDVGNVLTYDPGPLAYSQTYYATVIPYNNNGSATGCDTISFTIRDIPCGVTDQAIVNIFGESATATWVDEAGCTNVKVEYGLSPYTPGGPDSLNLACGTGTAALTGLTPESDYTVLIISQCLSGNDTTTLNFTTLCTTFTPTYIESFDSFVPDCWAEATSGTPATGPMGLGSGNWGGDGFGNVGTTGAARINLYTTTNSEWLLSPFIDLSTGGPYTLLYDVALTSFAGVLDTMLGSDDRVELLITIDSGQTWIPLEVFDNTSIISPTGQTMMVDLKNYDGVVKFAFYATDGVVDDANDVDFFVDNFQILDPGAIPSCTALTSPADGAIEVNENADFTWAPALGAPDNYRILVGTTPGDTNVLNVLVGNITTYDPGLLDFSQTYYVSIIPSNVNGAATNCDTTSFTVRDIPCGITNESVSGIGVDTARLEWTDEAGCVDVTIEYGEAPYTPGSGTSLNLACNVDSITLNGLSGDTEYDVLIISECAAGNDTTILSFTTGCPPFRTVPYCHNFDGSNNCWSVLDANADGSSWSISSLSPNSGTNHARCTWNGTNDADDWLFSPEINMVGGTEYNISFSFRARSASFFESIEVFAGIGDSLPAMTNQLFEFLTFNHTTYVVATMSFTPSVSETYTIGLHSISIADQFDIYVDDFCVTECGTAMVTTNSIAGPGALMDVLRNVCADGLVMFDAGVANDTLPMTAFLVDQELTIMGNGASVNILSGRGTDRLFWITPNGTLNVKDASLINGVKSSNGGAILNGGILDLNNVNMEGNRQGATPKSLTILPGSSTTVNGQVISKQ